MKKKSINVIVEGRMLDSDMQQIVGGNNYCTPIPGQPVTHINPCPTGGSYIVDPPCVGVNVEPPCGTAHITPPCTILHLSPCVAEPGKPTTHISV